MLFWWGGTSRCTPAGRVPQPGGTPAGGTPPPGAGCGDPPGWSWMGYPPAWSWTGYPHLDLGWGTPPISQMGYPPGCGQTNKLKILPPLSNNQEKQHCYWLTLGQNLLFSSQMAEFIELPAGCISRTAKQPFKSY